MAIRRLLVDGVENVCGCGASTVWAAADLFVTGGTVRFPTCPVCKIRSVVLAPRPGVIVEDGSPNAGIQRAYKAIFAWLVAQGRFAGKVTREQINTAILEGAPAWPTTGEVMVTVLPAYAVAWDAWVKNQAGR
jgi:hypothetical protein